jgi:two-component system, OmpR family, response regulator
MSATGLTARAARHPTHPASSARWLVNAKRNGANGAPASALTVTLAIPLNGEALTPEAHRLLEVVRELVELGQGTVTVGSPGGDAQRGEGTPRRRPSEPVVSRLGADNTGPADPHEVRLLTASRQVLLGGSPLPMTRLEFDLLKFLVDNPRRVFSRMQLLTAVWGYEHTGERTVDVHVRRLRVKLGAQVPLVTTVYGVGYRLADDAKVVIVAEQ